MSPLPFSSLTPLQQAQAGRIFQDAIFGTDSNAYAYELEMATGQLSGQRNRIGTMEKKIQSGKRSPLYITTLGKVRLSDLGAHILARMILPILVSDPAQIYSAMVATSNTTQ